MIRTKIKDSFFSLLEGLTVSFTEQKVFFLFCFHLRNHQKWRRTFQLTQFSRLRPFTAHLRSPSWQESDCRQLLWELFDRVCGSDQNKDYYCIKQLYNFQLMGYGEKKEHKQQEVCHFASCARILGTLQEAAAITESSSNHFKAAILLSMMLLLISVTWWLIMHQ